MILTAKTLWSTGYTAGTHRSTVHTEETSGNLGVFPERISAMPVTCD